MTSKLDGVQTIYFHNESAVAYLDRLDSGEFRLRDLYSNVRRKGYATRLLQEISTFADKHGLTLVLTVQRFGRAAEPVLDNKQLEALYSKFGFERTDTRPTKMIRRPSREIHAS